MTRRTGAIAPKKSAPLCDDMHDQLSREMMLRIAQDYDRLAERAEQRLRDRELRQ